ncbi:MAG: DUF438 domain-containing protein [Nitrospirae bacterium]|nr:DUF438 domain-containing protein [Nitrospirota bacterium]
MEINANTKLSAVLATYPFLKEFLIGLNPSFRSLDNPVMMRTLGRVATLGQVAMVGGMEPDRLIEKVALEIMKSTGQAVAVTSAELSQEERASILKVIIEDLHKGVELGILKKRFLDLIKDVSPSEIAHMEQTLIAGGMPESEVKRLCSVHVEVFKESLDKKTMPGLPDGHPVHTLMLENRHLESILHDIVEQKDAAGLARMYERIAPVEKHYLRKENQLFPILEAKGISGPSKVMWALHDDIRANLKAGIAKAAAGEFDKVWVDGLVAMFEDMIYKEEHILYPMALETLSEEDWLKVKRGEEEIGFAWVDGPGPMAPSGAAGMPGGQAGSLNLDTGRLTAEQVNLMLKHLPVDISFVDENDEVVYYSATADRIFPRSPAVIGRRVQNCHPPKSVHTVEKIIDAFKKGEKDTAEFWIQMKGRFIYIRYFAVRDDAGRYRGILEVSQDLTELRALEGDKRLLDWE